MYNSRRYPLIVLLLPVPVVPPLIRKPAEFMECVITLEASISNLTVFVEATSAG